MAQPRRRDGLKVDAMATFTETHLCAAPGRAGSPVELKERYDNFIGGALDAAHAAKDAGAGRPPAERAAVGFSLSLPDLRFVSCTAERTAP
jgi:hypothetical protein